MGGVRVLVGTAKGLFTATSDEARREWSMVGPEFGGWQVMHAKASPANPQRIWASVWTDWHGQVVHRSDDGGATWETVGNDFAYEGDPGEHPWYDGTPRPWTFKRIWHFEPSPDEPDTVWAGAEDAALFKSTDGGASWSDVAAFRTGNTPEAWGPGAGGLCLHTILIDPNGSGRMYAAVSAAGALRSDDHGATWKLINDGLHSDYLPEPGAPVGHCVHNLAMHPANPDTVFMQKHWHVCRSDDGGERWNKVSGNLPTDFGFPIAVHAREPETIYVVPIESDAEHYPPDGKLRVYRSRSGGETWEALTEGLPQANFRQNILRDAMSVDTLDPCGVYFGSTGGSLFASSDDGDSWTAVAEHLPRILSVEAQVVP